MTSYTEVDVAQKSPEWFAARCGRVTSSKAHLIFQKGRKKAGGGYEESVTRRDYIIDLACERLTQQTTDDDSYKGKWVERGVALEPDALRAYEAHAGVMARRVGFFACNDVLAGSSVDAIVGAGRTAIVVELKVPKPNTHLRYWDDVTELFEEYRYQGLMHLWVTGARRVDIVSYCPQVPEPLRVLVVPFSATPDEFREFDEATHRFLHEIDERERRIAARAQEVSMRRLAWRS
ncbi:MAG: YqaJ viral recombinase family protein [Vicinamibacterales bacterium]